MKCDTSSEQVFSTVCIFFFLLGLTAVTKAQNKFVAYTDPAMKYEGRILKKGEAAELTWPGSSVTMYMMGTSVSAILRDTDTANYYNVIVDDKVRGKIHTGTVEKKYILAEGLSNQVHKIQLFKRTESDKGKTFFYGFEIPDSDSVLAPPVSPKRKIEFYGNSITCGYAIEDSSGKDSGIGYFENNYLSYASITARHFNAQYSCVSKSGIGIMISWSPVIMPEIYDRWQESDSSLKWDFDQYKPSVVVVNLFQNDSWLTNMPQHEQFKRRFGKNRPDEKFIVSAYGEFIKQLRRKYPEARIICLLGNMDATKEGSPWPGYIRTALREMNDPGIFLHFFPFKNTNGHPTAAEQQVMADSLIAFIEEHIKW